MIKNYIKIAFRNLVKNKTYSLINVLGLSVGMCCCLLILIFVRNEWSYDTFHSRSDRIYRVWTEQRINANDLETNTLTPMVMGPELKANFPGVKSFTRVMEFSSLVKREQADRSFSELFSMVDSSFFGMFDFRMIRGERESVLNNPGNLVLTSSAAKRYFGEEDPLQNTLQVKMGSAFREYTITGVIEDPPANSSLAYGIMISFENSRELYAELAHKSWFFNVAETYVLLREGSNTNSLGTGVPAFLARALGEDYKQGHYQIGLQPLAGIHLNTILPAGYAEVSNPVYSYILSAVALLVLLLACINFMTLSVSKSVSRAREVGIRKANGARQSDLFLQFWGEALVMTSISIGTGLFLAESALPLFNIVSGKLLAIAYSFDLIMLVLGITLAISMVAGIYPAIVVSGMNPVEIFNGRSSPGTGRGLFRKGMIVTQFFLSIILIAGALAVKGQMDYVQAKDLGYNKDRVIVIESGIEIDYSRGLLNTLQASAGQAARTKKLLETEIQNYTGIEAVAASAFTPVQQSGWFEVEFEDEEGATRGFHFNVVDGNYLNTLEIDIIEGRNFALDHQADMKRAIIVNKALVDAYGWESPLAMQLPGTGFGPHEIIGVIENFHFESLHTPVKPLVLTQNPAPVLAGINNFKSSNSPSPKISVRLAGDNILATMDRLETAWNKISPEVSFNYTFLDQSADSQYRNEVRLGTLANIGAMIAVIIASMGLFGLASLMMVRRTKEIGVRKVLGASHGSILVLINREFTKLVVLAFLLAVPVAWFLLQQWMEQFAYRIDLGAGLFFNAGCIAVLVAWLAVSYHSVKAATMNPVDSLRSE